MTAIALPTLGGCGQKGPLYLPGNPSEIQTEVPKQESAQESGLGTQQELPTAEPQIEDEEDDETLEDQP
ncbi:MAG: lipoprotein [Woeseiaceae bacterium]|nr:lipoprotein [Woeseiaceae bacterium]